ncbi:MAG TPA: Cof-type HAD-IIB family hydrolase [Caulobacteraceae bacterium]
MAETPGEAAPIALVISDVDGTLVTTDKQLTPAAKDAVRRLDAAGIGFTLISSRPPRGMAAVAEALQVRLPMAAFNGGTLFAPDQSLIEAHHLQAGAAREALGLLEAGGVGVWVDADGAWRLEHPDGAHVDHERHTIGFAPTVVSSFEEVMGRIDKIVGVSDDHALLAALTAKVAARLKGRAEVMQSQTYYLDVTHPLANKGDGVRALCRRIGVDLANVAVLGDMFNDVAMFEVAGFSVAMGQSPDPVKAAARAVSPASNDADGFARAVEEIILPRAGRVPA